MNPQAIKLGKCKLGVYSVNEDSFKPVGEQFLQMVELVFLSITQ